MFVVHLLVYITRFVVILILRTNLDEKINSLLAKIAEFLAFDGFNVSYLISIIFL